MISYYSKPWVIVIQILVEMEGHAMKGRMDSLVNAPTVTKVQLVQVHEIFFSNAYVFVCRYISYILSYNVQS